MVRLTSLNVSAIADTDGPKVYWDEELQAFGAEVFRGRQKTYVVNCNLNGRQHNVAIGTHAQISAERARGKAFEILSAVRAGHSPVEILSGAHEPFSLCRESPTQQVLSFDIDGLGLPHNRLPEIPSITATTRVGIDDFDIFKIWHKYVSSFASRFAIVIFKRSHEDVSPILDYADEHGIISQVVKCETFRNSTTLNVMKDVLLRAPADLVYHSDTDEFITGPVDAFLGDCALALSGNAVLLRMKDRVSDFRALYDVAKCTTYRDLCQSAPYHDNLTGALQGWATTKVTLQRWPHIYGLHDTSGAIRELLGRCHLDHFKWRLSWLPKAKRRLVETERQQKPWSQGIAIMLDFFRAPRRLSV